MTVEKIKNGSKLTVKIQGRLDTSTAPALEAELKAEIDGISELVFDIKELEYISSAGLRVLLFARKCMSQKGSMVVKNANEDVKEVFDITGFSDVLTIL